MNKDDIYQEVTRIISELFEVDTLKITPNALLYTDLEIDSIDAIDLALELKSLVGRKIGPEEFKHVRTVQDIVDAVYNIQ
jgi:acyl carrier protein